MVHIECPSCKRVFDESEIILVKKTSFLKGERVHFTCPHCHTSIKSEPIGEKKDCCIIATCALPAQHPDLQYLRHFRDEVLKPTKSGHLIVYLYYALSPPIALMVLSSKRVKQLVRRKFIPFWIKICKEWEEQKKNTRR